MNDTGFPTDPSEPHHSLMPTGENQSIAPQSAYAPPAPVWLDNEEEEGINFIGFLHSLRRRWIPGMLIGSVLATLVAAALWVIIPVNSEAVALLRVSMSENQVLSDPRRGTDQRQYEVYKQTQAALVKSPFVLSAALRPPAVQNLKMIKESDKPLAMLEKELYVGYPANSEILRVSMSGDNEDETKQIVNAVVDAYMTEVGQNEKTQLMNRLTILRNHHRTNEQEIKKQLGRIQSLAEKFGTSDSQIAVLNQRIEQEALKALDNERLKARAEVEKIQGDLYVQQQVIQSRVIVPNEHEVADELERDPEYNNARLNLDALQRQMQQFGGIAKGGSAIMSRMQQEMATWQEVMGRRKRELLPRINHRIAQRTFGANESLENTQIAGLQARLQVAGERYNRLDEQFEDQLQEVKDLTGFSEELVTRKNDLEMLQKANNEIAEEINRLQLNINSPPRVQSFQRAIIPDRSSMRLKQMEVVASWLGTFLLSLVGVAVWDYFSKRLNTSKEIEGAASVRVIGALPALRGGWLSKPASELEVADAVDSIRAAIDYGNQGKPIHSVVVTSALSHEGKSTLASQLAVSLARAGRKTLLIDGDVRNPQLHTVFGMPGDRGICDVLRGQGRLEEVVQSTPAENLWILPAGRCDTVAYQALSGAQTSSILDRLRAQFDFIVVDSGPVLTGPESLIFGQFVDGAVVSTRRDQSRLPKVDEATRRLRSLGIHIVGAVVNGARVDSREVLPALPQS